MLVVIESNVFIIREAAAQSITYHDGVRISCTSFMFGANLLR